MKVLTGAILIALTSTAVTAKTLEEATQTYPIDSDGSISVENINGSITIESYGGSDIEFTYIITGRSDRDRERIEVKVDSDDDSFVVETDHNSSGWGWNSGGSASASYELRVPQNVTLQLIDTVNGSITINGQFGDVTADTVNGDISFEGESGDINLDTVNGSIDLSLDRLELSLIHI